MIAAIEWVPAGVADENPKKYEMNATEKDVIRMLQEQQQQEEEEQADGKNKNSAATSTTTITTTTTTTTTDSSNASLLVGPTATAIVNNKTSKEQQELLNKLPAELRMDEYSDDEDNEKELAICWWEVKILKVWNRKMMTMTMTTKWR